MNKIVIATTNPGKVDEFRDFFRPIGWEVETLLDHPELPEIEETGKTFEENACIKASEAAKILNLPVIADDSGLCVDVLNGAPGVYSARYAGEEKNDAANRQKLLVEMIHVPEEERTAHFHCTLAVANQTGEIIATFDGRSDGVILKEERGEKGFGYDSLLYVPEKKQTMAEMTAEEKGQISHRGRAIAQLKECLRNGGLDVIKNTSR